MKITVIIPTYLDANKPYLDLAIESVRRQREKLDVDLIVVSSTKEKQVLPSWVNHIHKEERTSFSKANNIGIKAADPNTKHFFFLNDDAIIPDNTLHYITTAAAENDVILNPMSNCDNYRAFVTSFALPGNHGQWAIIPQQLRIDYITNNGLVDAIFEFNKYIIPTNVLIPQHRVCFYGTLIPKKVIDKVGLFNEELIAGFEDEDYCVRARQHGINNFISLNCVLFHFSGTTADVVLTAEERRKDIETYNRINSQR